jgi:hypothetical protein
LSATVVLANIVYYREGKTGRRTSFRGDDPRRDRRIRTSSGSA